MTQILRVISKDSGIADGRVVKQAHKLVVIEQLRALN